MKRRVNNLEGLLIVVFVLTTKVNQCHTFSLFVVTAKDSVDTVPYDVTVFFYSCNSSSRYDDVCLSDRKQKKWVGEA